MPAVLAPLPDLLRRLPGHDACYVSLERAEAIDPARVNPTIPVDFCCDHALIAIHGGRADARALNERIELERNAERFAFLKWCEQALANVRLLPPGSGVMHQLNLEYLASVVRLEQFGERAIAMPGTLPGTDSHTPRCRPKSPTAITASVRLVTLRLFSMAVT